MSSKELQYDKEELECTVRMARKMIKALEESIEIFNEPEKHEIRKVHAEYCFVSAAYMSFEHNAKLIKLGVTHGLAAGTEGFTSDPEEDNTRYPLDRLPIFETEKEREDSKKRKALIRNLMDALSE